MSLNTEGVTMEQWVADGVGEYYDALRKRDMPENVLISLLVSYQASLAATYFQMMIRPSQPPAAA